MRPQHQPIASEQCTLHKQNGRCLHHIDIITCLHKTTSLTGVSITPSALKTSRQNQQHGRCVHCINIIACVHTASVLLSLVLVFAHITISGNMEPRRKARCGDDPTLTSETRQGIFKVRLPKHILTHYHAFITQSGCTGGKRQAKGATHTRTSNLLVARRAT